MGWHHYDPCCLCLPFVHTCFNHNWFWAHHREGDGLEEGTLRGKGEGGAGESVTCQSYQQTCVGGKTKTNIKNKGGVCFKRGNILMSETSMNGSQDTGAGPQKTWKRGPYAKKKTGKPVRGNSTPHFDTS